MIIKRIEGCTRTLGVSQGYLGLPVRDCVDAETGQHYMQTAWELTPDELDHLNRGAQIVLSVIGTGHPPVTMTVDRAPPVD